MKVIHFEGNMIELNKNNDQERTNMYVVIIFICLLGSIMEMHVCI